MVSWLVYILLYYKYIYIYFFSWYTLVNWSCSRLFKDWITNAFTFEFTCQFTFTQAKETSLESNRTLWGFHELKGERKSISLPKYSPLDTETEHRFNYVILKCLWAWARSVIFYYSFKWNGVVSVQTHKRKYKRLKVIRLFS